MPGYPVTKADVNNRAGAISLAVRNALTEAAAFDAWLDTQPDADLVNLGFVQAEVNTIKSAFADLAQLSTIWTGAAAE